MTLLWRKQMVIGDERIDPDHKFLICPINTVEMTLRTDRDRDLLATTLDQLHGHTLTHFESEERIILAIRYSRFDQHKLRHQLLIRELGEIRKQLKGKADGEFTSEECEPIGTCFAIGCSIISSRKTCNSGRH